MVDELKLVLKEKNLTIGKNSVLEKIKQGKIKKIFLASNCPENLKKDVEYYTTISKLDVIQLKRTNEEIGVVCKRKHFISILGY